MIINKQLWEKAYLLLSKQKVSRQKLSELLEVSDRTAGNLIFAFENLQLLKFEPEIYEIENKRTILFFSDLHIPFENKISVEIMLDYVKQIKPDTIIVGGDLIDFYKISTYIKNPKERNTNIEIKLAKQFLINLRNDFPDSEIIYIEGNHEQRFERYIIKNAVELYDVLENFYPEKLGLEHLNIKYQKGVFRIGKLWFLHGHEVNVRNYNVEYITNVMWKRIHSNFICGHWHRTQDKTWKNISGKYYAGFVVGALCKDLDYQPINNWNNGFAVIRFDNRGFYKVENKKIINGEIY